MTPLFYSMLVAIAVVGCIGFFIGKLIALQDRVAMLEAMLRQTVHRQGMHEAVITRLNGCDPFPVVNTEKDPSS